MPVVVVAAVLIYWLGAMVLAILGGIVAVFAVAIPFVLKVLCVVTVLGVGIWVSVASCQALFRIVEMGNESSSGRNIWYSTHQG